ncbi:MAG: hypothetical protein JWN86_4133 [Planctomycetota bacterium]|nr:hypothetical protein [Planctomycetota bacterium]
MSEGELWDRVEELIERAYVAGAGPAKVAILEEAVRLSDTYGDPQLGWYARRELIEAAIFAEEPEKALAPFAWCLAQCDRDPQEFEESDLFWPFKWVVDNTKRIARVPMTGLLAMVEDMERRFLRQGAGLRAVWKSRLELAIFRGQTDEARALYAKWDSTPRDIYADCQACEQDSRVDYFIFDGQDARAVEVAGPILSGRMTCAEVPKLTYNRVMLPLVRLGRVADAMLLHQKGHRIIARKPMFVEDAAHHIKFLAVTDNLARALSLFETHLPWPRDPLASGRFDRFEFSLAARFLMERATAQADSPLALRLPKEFPLFQDSGRYDPAPLAAFFDSESIRLASVFDARNETAHFSERAASERSLHDLVTPCPLKPPPRT